MKPVLIIVAGLALTGCAGLSNGQGADVVQAVQAIASDPRCGHVDRISGNIGGMGGNNLNVFLERTCPAAPEALPHQ